MSESTVPKPETSRGPIAWMVHNRVTPNLLMITLLLGGLLMALLIKQEVFPDFESDTVTIRVAYPGSSPEEVEQGIVLVVEEAVRGMEGIKEVTATASEGSGRVVAELLQSANRQQVYQEIQAEVNRITTFPDDAEEPEVSLSTWRRDVMSIEVYGNVDLLTLRNAAEHLRDRLLQQPGVTQVDLDRPTPLEIHVEVPQGDLRRYGMTISDVADRIRASSIEIGGGKIQTKAGEVLLKVDERKDWADQYRQIPIISTANGSQLLLEDIATVTEGFEDSDKEETFNGQPSMEVEVFRSGSETPIGVADAARAGLKRIRPELPPGIDFSVRSDRSQIYRQRLELLLKNAFFGLVLVLLVLGLFLEFKLAFWVTMGIPISFLGGLLFMPWMGVSINMISMFAFIIALGIVVDDAIVAGENIYEYRQKGMSFADAAVQGARDVAVPIFFAILTNVIAFLPLLFIPGFIGKIWGVIPLVVCTVFIISLVEALFILPAHLAHTKSQGKTALTRFLHGKQQDFARLIQRGIDGIYAPFLSKALTYRPLTLAIALAILMLIFGLLGSGRMGFILMPRVESDRAEVTAVLPLGSPISESRKVRDQLLAAGNRVVAEHGQDQLTDGVSAQIQENEVEIRYYLTQPGIRPISTTDFTNFWRDQAGPMPSVESSTFESEGGGPGGGAALTVELSHQNISTLRRAAEVLADRLREFAVTRDVNDGYTPGKQQLDFTMTPQGESLGLTASTIARQVRNAFQGEEAIKQQRGRNEITVRVRRPEAQRSSMHDLEQMIIQTPDGGEVPLMTVANVKHDRAYTTISRRNGRRTVQVTANIVPIGQTSRIQGILSREVLPALAADFPGLTYQYEGRQAEMSDSLWSLFIGLGLSLSAIYIVLAVPFRSYIQPIIVMMAIPFGVVGAVIGHLIMGYNISVISIMGVVALAGVVVNDALVMVEYANRLRDEQGHLPFEAIRLAGVRRFRPILLTTLTTFGGLAPMIFETSRQARFMIPMAISLGFGILFATAITLVIVPTLYLLLEDVKAGFRKAGEMAIPDAIIPTADPDAPPRGRPSGQA